MLLTLPMLLQLAAAEAPSVAPETLAAFAQYESGLDPNAIHDNTTGLSFCPATADDAVAIAKSLLRRGHSLDLGLMQINDSNYSNLGLTVRSAFDPSRSLRAGAQILVAAYQGCLRGGQVEAQTALRCAASVYNTGTSQAGLLNGYQARVWRVAAQIVPVIQPDVGTTSTRPSPTPSGDVAAPQPRMPPPALEDVLHLAPPVPGDSNALSDALHFAPEKETP